jgi:hypothetical protein
MILSNWIMRIMSDYLFAWPPAMACRESCFQVDYEEKSMCLSQICQEPVPVETRHTCIHIYTYTCKDCKQSPALGSMKRGVAACQENAPFRLPSPCIRVVLHLILPKSPLRLHTPAMRKRFSYLGLAARRGFPTRHTRRSKKDAAARVCCVM